MSPYHAHIPLLFRHCLQIGATIQQLQEQLKRKEATFSEFVQKYGRFLSTKVRSASEQQQQSQQGDAKQSTGVLV
jgi:hypothetical protein